MCRAARCPIGQHNSTTAQQHNSTTAQQHNSTTAQQHNSTSQASYNPYHQQHRHLPLAAVLRGTCPTGLSLHRDDAQSTKYNHFQTTLLRTWQVHCKPRVVELIQPVCFPQQPFVFASTLWIAVTCCRQGSTSYMHASIDVVHRVRAAGTKYALIASTTWPKHGPIPISHQPSAISRKLTRAYPSLAVLKDENVVTWTPSYFSVK
jgi:hypothetical protein